jgi:hypothetical protein
MEAAQDQFFLQVGRMGAILAGNASRSLRCLRLLAISQLIGGWLGRNKDPEGGASVAAFP